MGLAGPGRSGERRGSRPDRPIPGVAIPVWVPGGIEESASRQDAEVFSAGSPAALRRMSRVALSRSRISSVISTRGGPRRGSSVGPGGGEDLGCRGAQVGQPHSPSRAATRSAASPQRAGRPGVHTPDPRLNRRRTATTVRPETQRVDNQSERTEALSTSPRRVRTRSSVAGSWPPQGVGHELVADYSTGVAHHVAPVADRDGARLVGHCAGRQNDGTATARGPHQRQGVKVLPAGSTCSTAADVYVSRAAP